MVADKRYKRDTDTCDGTYIDEMSGVVHEIGNTTPAVLLSRRLVGRPVIPVVDHPHPAGLGNDAPLMMNRHTVDDE